MAHSLKLSFILLGFFIIPNSGLKAQCLSGSYQIGGTGSNFTTFQSAVDTLKKYGVCGPVVLQIAPGTYTERVTIPAIVGASATNVIRFVSANADETILQYPSATTSTLNYTLMLDGADYITFEKLTIKRTGTSTYAYAVDLRNGADYITFKDDIMSCDYASSSGNTNIIYSPNTIDNYLTVTGCKLIKGRTGINLSGISSTQYETGLTVTNNIFTDQYSSTLGTSYHSNIEFSNNVINTSNASSSSLGVFLSSCFGEFKAQNNVFTTSGSYVPGNAFYITSCTFSAVNPGLIVNNLINMGSSSSYGAINLNSTNNVSMYYNTIKNSYANAVYINGGSNIRFKNNNVMSSGNLIQLITPAALVECDYNNLYSNSSSTFSTFNSTACTTFADWKIKSGKDQHSVSFNPKFMGQYDLHINRDVDLHDKGNPITGITTDFDGDLRDPSNPDIGADEFTLPANNMSLLALISPTKTICNGAVDVKVVVRNFGSNSVTDFDIYWEKNKVLQPVFHWNGISLKGQTDTITIANTLFTLDQAYTTRAWLGNPNGVADAYPANDSSAVTNVYTKMQGVYTIGGFNPVYKDFKTAFADLQLRGVCGPVVFNVRQGVYKEGGLTLTSPAGTSKINTVTFQSEDHDSSAVKIAHPQPDGFDQCIKLINCNNIIFRQITLNALVGDYQIKNALLLQNCKNIYAYNCNFVGGSYETVLATGTSDSLYFLNNKILYGTHGLSLNAYRTVIRNNQLDGQTGFGISVVGYTTTIDRNEVSSTRGQFNYEGIYASGVGNSSITNNKANFSLGYAGIHINGSFVLISNNFIRGGTTSQCYGLYLLGPNKAYYNTVEVTASETTNSAAIWLVSYSAASMELKNNILFNSGGGRAIKYTSALNTFVSNYNDLYTTGSALVNAFATFAAWKTGSNYDLNSVSVQPVFVSATDMHGLTASTLGGKGVTLAGQTYDFDGDLRKAVPDIGADEFGVVGYDAGISWTNKPTAGCKGNPYVYVKVTNFGSDTLRHAAINWSVNNVAQTAVEWIGKIAPGQTSGNIKLANYYFPYGTPSALKIWTALESDANHNNDTLKIAPFFERMGGTYTVGGTNPDFNSITAASKAVNALGVCAPVVFSLRDGYYEDRDTIRFTPGSSKVNTVTFTSASADSTKVIWYADNIRSTGNTLQLDDANNLVFSNMTISCLRSNYDYYQLVAIGLKNGCENITFTNNVLEGRITAIASSDNHITIRRNLLTRSPIMLQGVSLTEKGIGNRIEENRFASNAEDAMTFFFQDSLSIIGNVFVPDYDMQPANNDDNFLTGSIIGVSDSGPTIAINHNRITTRYNCYCYPDASAIMLSKTSGTAAAPIVVYNNFISLTDLTHSHATRIVGLDNFFSNYVNYYHNSVFIDVGAGHENNNIGFLLSGGTGIRFENNILSSLRDGFALITALQPTPFLSCDYNNYYIRPDVSRERLVSVGSSVVYNNLAQWQQASGLDMHSYSVDPGFMAEFPGYKKYEDLHLNPNQLTPLYVPNPKPGMDKDIDGEPRSLSTPIIGADEYTPLVNNAQAIQFELPSTTPCEGINDILLSVANYGTQALNTVTVQWTVNGVAQTPYNWSGSLASLDTTMLTIGQYNFVKGGAVNLQAWTENPNGMTDLFTAVDTTYKTLVPTSLHGTYTIGGAGADYPTFTMAVKDLVYRGICSSVTFNARAGTYNEQIRIPKIKGSSALNTITFQSENNDSTSVILTRAIANNSYNNVYNYIVHIDGADHLTIRGMTLRALLGNYCRVVYIGNGASEVAFVSNVIQSKTGVSGYFDYNDAVHIGPEESLTNGYMNYITFKNNRIEGGAVGLSMTGSTGGYNGPFNKGLVVSGNVFTVQNSYGLNIRNTIAPSIVKNTFNSVGYIPMGIFSTRENTIVSENKVNFTNIYNAYYYSLVVMDDHKSTSDATAGIVANNMVFVNNFYANASQTPIFSSSRNKNLKIVYNSISLNKLKTSSQTVVFSSDQDTSLTLKNNIFSNRTGNMTMTINRAILLSSDYNDLYTTGTSLVKYGNTTYANLADYSLATGQDLHSINQNPLFVQDTSDLHVSSASPVVARAAVIPEVTKDIDGEMRTSSPSIGADERIGGLANNAALVAMPFPAATDQCPGLKTVQVSLKNLGTNVLSACTIQWEINGVQQAAYAWTGTLPTGAGTDVTIGTYDFVIGNAAVKAYVSLPNGASDEYFYNDTINKALAVLALPVADFTFTIEDHTVAFANATTGGTSYAWDFDDASAVSTSENPSHVYNEGTYDVTLQASNGCGSATVTKSVSIIPTDVEAPLSESSVTLYPNPSAGNLRAQWKGVVLTEISVTTMTGVVIYHQLLKAGDQELEIALENSAPGIYRVEMKTQQGVQSRMLSIQK